MRLRRSVAVGEVHILQEAQDVETAEIFRHVEEPTRGRVGAHGQVAARSTRRVRGTEKSFALWKGHVNDT